MLPFNAYVGLKDLIGSVTHLSPDALHVHLGLAVFLAAAAVLRSDRRWLHAFGLLLLVSLGNEIMDLTIDYWHGDRLRWLNGLKDIVNTVFWPAVWVVCGPLVTRILSFRARPIDRAQASPAIQVRTELDGAGK